jgi:hypothetical protein
VILLDYAGMQRNQDSKLFQDLISQVLMLFMVNKTLVDKQANSQVFLFMENKTLVDKQEKKQTPTGLMMVKFMACLV